MVLVYPQWHKVSFTIVAEKHIRELRKYLRLYTIDELALSNIYPYTRPLIILHPTFYIMARHCHYIDKFYHYFKGIIGIDVADSDKISSLAVSMTNYCEAMIVPSNFSREVYLRSGVTVPVYVVPHGVDDIYFEKKKEFRYFKDLYELKKKKGYIYLLSIIPHSGYRKGLDLVLKAYAKLRRVSNNFVLVLKLGTPNEKLFKVMRGLGGITLHGWLKEEQLIELYDLCDIYLLFSRGGGFEIPSLESLVRGEVVIAPNKGPWTEYLPKFSLVRCHECPYVLKDNPIHCGKGYEIDVDEAVQKILHISKYLDYYKEKVRKHVEEKIKNYYNWKRIGKMLANIIKKYL